MLNREPAPFDPSLKVTVKIVPVATGKTYNATVLSDLRTSSDIALVPADVPLGPADVIRSFGGVDSPPVRVTAVASNFALFTHNGGFGPAVAQNISTSGTIELNALTRPARVGQWVTLWGTGLGTADPASVRATLGGHPVLVGYAGPSPGNPGLDQVNVLVPADPAIPDSCYAAVQVHAGDTDSNVASISKARGTSARSSPFGLTIDQSVLLDAGQSIPFVQLNISGSVAMPDAQPLYVRDEGFDGYSLLLGAPTIASFTQPSVADDVFYAARRRLEAGPS